MTLEELELDPSSKFIIPGTEPPMEPLVIGVSADGKWMCKECKVWVDGAPKDICGWCERYHKNLAEFNSTAIESSEELPKYIFKRTNEDGTVTYCMMSEDGRVVDLDD